jgi:uncharacterized membrane protein YidH (DUF202 family)
MRAARFPRWVCGEGSEPDPRFTLANERTFLAWIRTALALTAGGVALEALTVPLLPGLRLAASLLLLVLGLAAVLGAHLGRMLLTRQRKLGSKVEIFLPKGPQRGDSLSGSLSRRTACRCSSPACVSCGSGPGHPTALSIWTPGPTSRPRRPARPTR